MEVNDVIKLLRVRYSSADVDEILGADTDYDTGRKLASDFVERSGLRTLPQVRWCVEFKLVLYVVQSG